MENVIEELQTWSFLQELPAAIAGFNLEMNMQTNGALYEVFTYANLTQHRKFAVLYDSATKDYLVKITVGLTEYCDISFICSKLILLETALKERMVTVLNSLAGYDTNSTVCSVFKQKKILEWSYVAKLPEKVLDFQLFIRPTQPVKVINGSYIILDYSDFSQESNLIIYYNIFRDEFFGEARIRRTPQMTACFDTSELNELAEKIEGNLADALQSIRNQL